MNRKPETEFGIFVSCVIIRRSCNIFETGKCSSWVRSTSSIRAGLIKEVFDVEARVLEVGDGRRVVVF